MFGFEELKKTQKALVMGILNVTPDSFYDGGKYTNATAVLARTEEMLRNEADIIDIGGYSSRPNAENVSADEELRRLAPNIENILKHFPNTVISVDTFRAEIAERLVRDYHIPIINDISGGTLDENMFATIARLKVCYVLMHMRGNPTNMQNFTSYNNVCNEVFSYLSEKIGQLTKAGVSQIILDPGFGFAKTVEQNYELLHGMKKIAELGYPVLAGLSRKSMLWKPLHTTPDKCLCATVAANMLALTNGAKILRVHDVKAAVDTITIFEQYNGFGTAD